MNLDELVAGLYARNPILAVEFENALQNPEVPVEQWPAELDIDSLCKCLFRSEPRPGVDSYGITPARQMADQLRLYIDPEVTP
ncbi:MAG: hypothetical protein LBR23_01905 [Spirochaetaceae bacterium]|jgi:hypothetical protein|nr:hypothetical protein [Spirochaetaceae bacterium]